ncbi:PREDICTED: uncharacterized protein LOC109476843 [Branchiostoma belcheri]|uniref:Uncharacterized protein LOC109476843 n=1 Tax=Branchiostoma belcheri TaxID=7741 RepID=A0A6P4YVP3_BRABE|nr:PREDICTED: uncharacterized protein LOC109476843 [Branchiostoma belcheri]
MSDNSHQPAASTELTSAGPNTVSTPVHRMTYPDIDMTNLDMAQLTDDDDRSLVNFLLGELGETHEAYLDFLAASLDEETIQSLDDVMASDLASLGAGNTDALVDSSGAGPSRLSEPPAEDMEHSDAQQVIETLAPITLEAWDSAGFEGTRASVISLMHIYKHNSFVSVACYFIIYLFIFWLDSQQEPQWAWFLDGASQDVQDQPMSDSPPEFAMDAETQTAGPESVVDVGTQTTTPETPLDLRLKRPADANWGCPGAPPAKRHKFAKK